MAVKKAGISQELHPKDPRKSSQGKKLAVLQHTKWFPHLYRAHSGSRLFTNPNFRVPMLLAKFGPCWDAFCNMHVLVDALICISTIPDEDTKPWIAGPGSKTMFHARL